MASIDPNPDADLTLEQHEQRLVAGELWLDAEWKLLQLHPNRRDAERRLNNWMRRTDLWITWLRAYERHFNAIQRGTVPHIQEVFL